MIIQTRHPHQKSSTRIGSFKHVSCHNPNSTSHWSSVLETPLNVSKKPLTKYSWERMKAMMTRQKMVMTMETMVARNRIEKSNLIILWMRNGVSSYHPRKNQTFR